MPGQKFWVGFLLLFIAQAALGETSWEVYLANPTSENAALVQRAKYSDTTSWSEQLYGDLSLLEIQVICSDREAVRLAFRLFGESDGHYSETLDIILGRLIRINPELFLEELKDHKGMVTRMDALLGNYGGAYVDRFDAQLYETKERIMALKNVTNPSLREIQSECLTVLRDQLER